MRPRNYLFVLSLLLIAGCSEAEPDHSKCEAARDSIEAAYAQSIDSLYSVIESQKAEITKLEDEVTRMNESASDGPSPVGAPKVPEKRPQGDPTDDPVD